MKRILALAGSLGLALAATGHAQTKIYITGSTAYRGNTHTAIQRTLDTGYTYAYDGSTVGGSTHAIFNGKVGGQSVIVKTSWSGSEAGIQAVSNGVAVNFLPDGTITSVNAGSLNTGGTATAQAANDAEIPQICLADTYQGSARAQFNVTTLTDTQVGVVPFVWVASPSAPSGLNINANYAKALYSTGYGSLSLLTSNLGDLHTVIYATGRDPDSGTRATAFAESGVGVFTNVKQNKPAITGQSAATDFTSGFGGTVNTQAKYPANQSINGVLTGPAGNTGESSGGTLAKNLSATLAAAAYQLNDASATGGFYLAYLGTGDAAGALENGCKLLSYDGASIGVTFSPALPIPAGTAASAVTATFDYTNIRNGSYTFWGYEHLDYLSTLSGLALTFANNLATNIISTDAQVTLSSMAVQRTGDGLPVSTKSF